jgi:tRNA G18 (ribose-2'-O)-methylase SpoU
VRLTTMSSEENVVIAAAGITTSLNASIAVCTRAGAQIVFPPVS